jgi:hypothetical protein
MNEVVLIASLLGVIVFQGAFIYLQKRVYDEVEKDLLNRLMSRNYETYVQAQELMKPKRELTPEEIYEMQKERGIPV